MENGTVNLRATYNPNLDILYLRTLGCTGSWLDSEDGVFFFAIFNNQDQETLCGFEIHFFSGIWDDEVMIPDLDVRFDILGTEIRDADLSEVLQWAFETFVKPRQRVGQMAYSEAGEGQLEAVHENQGKADYET